MFDPNITLTTLEDLKALLPHLEPNPPICGRFEEHAEFSRRNGFTGETKYNPDGSGTCNHCGSLSQSQFFEGIVAGCELGTTDKSYKVYVHSANENFGKSFVKASANYAAPGYAQLTPENIDSFNFECPQDKEYHRQQMNERPHWVKELMEGPIKQNKFYFQHLTETGMGLFVMAYNAKLLKYKRGYGFYVLPYFMRAK